MADSKTNTEQDYAILLSEDKSDSNSNIELLTADNVKEKSEQWMLDALQRYESNGQQFSVHYNPSANSNSSSELSLNDIKELAQNAQSDISKIIKINSFVRQAANEDDIIGRVHEAVEANLNSNVTFTFDNLPEDFDKDIREKTSAVIKRFHREINIDDVMTNAITTTYDEGNCILYLRSRKQKNITHHIVDKYPLGIALVSDYSVNSIPCVLIDLRELGDRLQKTTLKNKKNKPLFFKNLTDEIKNNYPEEVYKGYITKEKYAKLDYRRTGVSRFGNMNRKYGLTPIFKALKPKVMLDIFDKSDATNAKAKAKKIIVQIMRKENMGKEGKTLALDRMAYAHQQLIGAWQMDQVVYTPPPYIEKIEYIEPKVELTDERTIMQYRSRVTSALGISFLNTDGQQTVSTANISIKQLMRTIDKIAGNLETILQRWYEIILTEENIPIEYCPTPHILDAELLELEIKKDLVEFMFSKLNCSFETAYDMLGVSYANELQKRLEENEKGISTIFAPHATSYNSAGDTDDVGRPSGSTEGDNEVNDKKAEYDKNYQKSKTDKLK